MAHRPPLGPGNPFEAGPGLLSFRAAWAKRLLQPVNVLCIGDSITQGYWASDASLRWFEVFLTRLMQNNGQQVPIGYVPLNGNGLTAYTGRDWTGKANLTDRDHFEGPTLTSMALAADSPGPTGDATFSGVCDRIALLGTSYTSFVGATRINIDGGADINVNFPSYGSDKGSRIWLSTALARGPHSIRVRTQVGQVFGPVIEGCILFDGNGPTVTGGGTGLVSAANFNTGSGLRIYNLSHNGYTTTSWTTTDSRPWHDCMDYFRPHLITVLLGCNDEFTNMSLATYETNLQAMIDQVNTVAASLSPVLQPPSFLFIGMYGTGSDGDMLPYNAVMRKVALRNRKEYIDWYDLMGYVGLQTADVFDLISDLDSPTDGKHPSDQGHQLLGDHLAQWFVNAIGPTGQIPRQPTKSIVANGRVVSDAVLNGTTTVTSATANFQTTDVGKTVSGIGIPIGATITARASTTSITISSAATLSVTGVTMTIADTQPALKIFTDNKVYVDCTTCNQVLRIPTPVGNSSQEFMIKKIDNGPNRVILYCAEGNIDGGAQYDMDTPMHSVTVTSDGSAWWCI